MKTARTAGPEWGTWLVSVAIAGALAAAAVSLFPLRLRLPPPHPAPTGPAVVVFRPAPSASADFADPAVLYMLNRWSAKPRALADDAIERPGDTLLLPIEGRLAVGPVLRLELPPPVPVPDSPAGVLDVGPPLAPYAGFGRSDIALPVAAARVALVQAFDMGDGRPVGRWPIVSAPVPTAARDWKPLEFSIVVDLAGLVGKPSLVSSSGVPEVDRFFRDYLENTLRVGAQLEAGSYRIRVEP